MKYREFGNTGIKISSLGFGCMRLPMIKVGEENIVDEEKTIEMIKRAYELGVNYFDSAFFYCGGGSEIALGKAIKGFRDKVYISTKCPSDRIKEYGSYRKVLEKQIEKLDINYIDFYHYHGINYDHFMEVDKEYDWINGAKKAKEDGLIKHISFSFHGKPESMMKLVDLGIFDSVLCQYNLVDRSNEEAIAYAKSKGLGVAVMGPVGGGRVSSLPPTIAKGVGVDVKTSAEMALRFVLANPNVDCALSGMGNIDMVEENCATASNLEPLTQYEVDTINKMMDEKKKLAQLYCTGCSYCMPHCPQKVNIQYIFELMNAHKIYGSTEYARAEYARLEEYKTKDATGCIECGICEEKCPQKLPIIEKLKECHEALKAQ